MSLNLFAAKPTEGYILLDDPLGTGSNMVLTGPWQSHFTKVIQSRAIRKLTLSYSAGWREKDIGFLKDIPDLDSIVLNTYERIDLSPLIAHLSLKSLALPDNIKSKFDLSQHVKLEYLAISWNSGLQDLPTCHSLKQLKVSAYPYADVVPIAPLSNLEKLTLFSKKLVSLNGLSAFHMLSQIELYYCSNLIDIESLNDCPSLSVVDIGWGKRLMQLPDNLRMPNLKKFSVTNSHDIESLLPLKGCENLEELIFYESTNIRDGQIAFLASLPAFKNAQYQNRKHYDITREALKQLLQAKRN